MDWQAAAEAVIGSIAMAAALMGVLALIGWNLGYEQRRAMGIARRWVAERGGTFISMSLCFVSFYPGRYGLGWELRWEDRSQLIHRVRFKYMGFGSTWFAKDEIESDPVAEAFQREKEREASANDAPAAGEE